MTENPTPIKLTDWAGDSDSLIVEMKRRAGVGTDGDLAAKLGLSQSAVAHWRRRKVVPESALLAFERIFSEPGDFPHLRVLYARTLAMRLAEYDYQKMKTAGGLGGRKLTYSLQAMQLEIVTDECFRQLDILERRLNIDADQALGLLIEDTSFYEGLSKWASNIPAVDALVRFHQAGRLVVTKRAGDTEKRDPQ